VPNTNLTVDWIGNEALRLAHEKLSFIGTINREFDSSFKPGYGNTIRIRVPSQYTVTTGRVIDVQDGVQQSTSITVATQRHVAMRYNSQEYSQDLVNFQKLHLEPAMAILAHPETKAAYSHLQNFVTEAGSTATTLIFQPAIRLSGARKNVARSDGTDITATNQTLISTGLVTFSGVSTSTYQIGLMYHRDAFTFATAALPIMDDAIRCVVKTYDGISLRVWEASDIRNDEKLTRIDILFGFAAIRPQWAVKVQSTGV